MSEQSEQLEREIDAGLGELGAQLDVALPESIRGRARMAARTAIDECWLSERLEVAAAKGSLARVRARVARELRRQARLQRIWRACSLAGAAAMVLLCIGLVQHATMLRRAATSAELASNEVVDLFVAAADQVSREDVMTAAIEEDLAAIEEGVTQIGPEPDALEDRLDDLGDEVDELIDGPVDGELML